MNTESDDEELVHRTLSGDTDAFAGLVRRHRRRAIACALAVLGDLAEAEDAAQDAFVRSYEELALCRNPNRFGAWLMTIVRHGALNRARTIRRRGIVALDESVVASGSPADAVARHELQAELLAALQKLTPVQRSVVLFADLEMWSHAEIAQALGISVTMSRRHLSDARRRLRSLLASSQ